jgi:glycosyltransferase involved in cell wall biosynthesis
MTVETTDKAEGAVLTVRQRVISVVARVAVLAILVGVATTVRCADLLRGVCGLGRESRRARPDRLLLTGTFYNEGWLRAHVMPLARCRQLTQVIVVCDAPLFAIENVVYACPPRWLVRIVGRSLARLLWIGRMTRLHRPGVLMGYHVMPNALMCLVVARLFGRQAIYQMTGGPVQIIGGGVGSENVLLRQLRKPSRRREALLFHLVRQFDCLVVRGRAAVEFARPHRLATRCLIVPGSIDCDRFAPPTGSERDYDLVCVGRLVPVKRHDRLLRIVDVLRRERPDVRVAVVGDGPLLDEARRHAEALGITEHVDFLGQRDDVPALLRRSRLFILTSENEGLSIAVIEAMACGLPVIAPNVGDLSELVVDGQNGLFVDPGDSASSARAIAALLADSSRVTRMSEAARGCAVERCGADAVAGIWDRFLGDGVTNTRVAADTVGSTSDDVSEPDAIAVGTER